jgi:hypothetical protein
LDNARAPLLGALLIYASVFTDNLSDDKLKGADMNIYTLISWLNSNSGALMPLLTTIYVFTTVWILRANLKMTNQMRLSREQLLKPALVASFESRRGGLNCFVLRNLGGSLISNLRIELSDEFINSLPNEKQERFRSLSSASLTMVPRQELIFCCGGPQDWPKFSKADIEGNLIYHDIFNKTNKEHFSIDIQSYEWTLRYGTEMDELTTTIKKGFGELNKTFQLHKGETKERT